MSAVLASSQQLRPLSIERPRDIQLHLHFYVLGRPEVHCYLWQRSRRSGVFRQTTLAALSGPLGNVKISRDDEGQPNLTVSGSAFADGYFYSSIELTEPEAKRIEQWLEDARSRAGVQQ